jgi:hypothetical protein
LPRKNLKNLFSARQGNPKGLRKAHEYILVALIGMDADESYKDVFMRSYRDCSHYCLALPYEPENPALK